MYRDGALESELVTGTNSFLRRPKLNPAPEMEQRFLSEISTAMRLAQSRLAKQPNDTGALYALGISYGLRSSFNWLVRKAWHESLKDATAGRRLHNRITEIDPQNVDARLVQGLHDYLVGCLPWGLRMVGVLVGIRGDKAKGMRTIEDVARHGNQNRVDAEVFLCALYRRENQTGRAVPLVADLIRRFPRNYLLRLELSQMYSMSNDKAHALDAVEEVARLKQSHVAGYDRVPWDKIWYQEGTIQFWYRELDASMENMKKVVASGAELDLNTGATAWLRIGQICDSQHRRAEAVEAYKKSVGFAPQADAAQEARRYLAAAYKR